jgi:hypothetical protein
MDFLAEFLVGFSFGYEMGFAFIIIIIIYFFNKTLLMSTMTMKSTLITFSIFILFFSKLLPSTLMIDY